MDILRLILLLLIGFLAWRLSSRHARAMRFCTALVAGVLVGGLMVLVVTGIGRQWWAWPGGAHRWAGHALTIQAWLAVPIAIGVILQQQLSQRPFRALLGVACCLLTMFFVVLAGITGYLNPSVDDPTMWFVQGGQARFIGEETRNRFLVLHQFVTPYLFALSLAGWFVIASFPPRTRPRETSGSSATA
jgi:hypothetical protein